MQNYSKIVNKELRDLNALAYERMLALALQKLGSDFQALKTGTIDVFELNTKIHQYYIGPARELYKHYSKGFEDMKAASALVMGLIKDEEISAPTKAAIANFIEKFEAQRQQGDLLSPDEWIERMFRDVK